MNDLVKQFLQSEYDRVAEAHFKSIEAISTFFRYYLLIMAVPGAAVTVLVQLGPAKLPNLSLGRAQLLRDLPLAICLLVVAVAGLGVCSYVTNLRLDTLLYARTVNGIRRACYDQWDISLEEKLRMRVLPWSTSRPNYFEIRYFLPVVSVFGLIDSTYMALAVWMLWEVLWPCAISFCAFFLIHIVLYWQLAVGRQHDFLTSPSMGVDIDGVLNLQTQHFVEYLNQNEGLNVQEEDILINPVHEREVLGVSQEQEQRVFNNPDYWTTMPAAPDAAHFLKKISERWGLDIVICTNRPWSVSGTREQLSKFAGRLPLLPSSVADIVGRRSGRPLRLMRRHTTRWLVSHGFINCKRVNLDNGSGADRFEIAKCREMRYFVEDELKNAVKLSYICDVVFLISKPYNQPHHDLGEAENRRRSSLPCNVVRVSNWEDIYRHLSWLE